MADTPKDKRALALERIKALASRRSANNTTPGATKDPAAGANAKPGAKQGNVGHRPQGG